MNVTQLMTAEELWEMPDVPDRWFELVDGDLVEVPGAGALHTLIVALIYKLIDTHAHKRDLGYVFPDGLAYILARDPDRVRIPDVSFVSSERVPAEGIPEGFWPGAPDLAVEVVSPHDKADDLHVRVHDYLEAGTRLVWVVWPRRYSVTVYSIDAAFRELGSDDMLDGGDVLPGFQVSVAGLFDVGR